MNNVMSSSQLLIHNEILNICVKVKVTTLPTFVRFRWLSGAKPTVVSEEEINSCLIANRSIVTPKFAPWGILFSGVCWMIGRNQFEPYLFIGSRKPLRNIGYVILNLYWWWLDHMPVLYRQKCPFCVPLCRNNFESFALTMPEASG